MLPNARDGIAVAEAAAAEARSAGIRVAVIPTRAQVQGIAAAAVHEPARTFDADVVAMTTAAGHTRHGAVTVAVREAVTSAGCAPGDVLGEGDFVVIGDDVRALSLPGWPHARGESWSPSSLALNPICAGRHGDRRGSTKLRHGGLPRRPGPGIRC